MTTAGDEYRRQARECIRSANLTAGQDVKASMLAMADRWFEFAEAMERFAILQAAVSPPDGAQITLRRTPWSADPRGHLRSAA